MSLYSDSSKQAVEVSFSRNINHVETTPIYFIDLAVVSCKTHKHLGLLVDKRLDFRCLVEEMILRANKGMGLITRLRRYIPRTFLLIIYQAFIRTHLDFRDVVYDYPGKAFFMQNVNLFNIMPT